MTSKEKAAELIKLYGNLTFNHTHDVFMNNEIAKSCALICVDEIIALDALTDDAWLSIPDEYKVQYWREVKTEIQNL